MAQVVKFYESYSNGSQNVTKLYAEDRLEAVNDYLNRQGKIKGLECLAGGILVATYENEYCIITLDKVKNVVNAKFLKRIVEQ